MHEVKSNTFYCGKSIDPNFTDEKSAIKYIQTVKEKFESNNRNNLKACFEFGDGLNNIKEYLKDKGIKQNYEGWIYVMANIKYSKSAINQFIHFFSFYASLSKVTRNSYFISRNHLKFSSFSVGFRQKP